MRDYHSWEDTYWKDHNGSVVTIKDILFKVKDEPAILLDIMDLDHIPSVEIDDCRKKRADLSCPIIILKKDKKIKMILDGHHRRSKAIEEGRKYIVAKVFIGNLFE